MTCANKINGNCHLPNRHCNWPKCEQPAPPGMVNHPKHYGSHPSGVECIELVRLLTFNMGNAVKYVMRRDDKGTAKQDLKKALWYLKDEKDTWQTTAVIMALPRAEELLNRIEKAEPNDYAAAFYQAMQAYLSAMRTSVPVPVHFDALIVTVENLLTTYP